MFDRQLKMCRVTSLLFIQENTLIYFVWLLAL